MPKRQKQKINDSSSVMDVCDMTSVSGGRSFRKKKKFFLPEKKGLQVQLQNPHILKKSSGAENNKPILLTNISHKSSIGCNNWQNFMGNMDKSNKSVNNRTEIKRLPLLKNNIPNEIKKKSSFSFHSKHSGGKDKIVTKIVALDCEMVGVGEAGTTSMVARVSMVNSFGECIYDKYVKPTEEVTDYRTWCSGIRPHDLENAEDFFTVQKEVSNILKGRILVGHAIKHDLDVLLMKHPWKFIRDSFTFRKFRKEAKGRLTLKNLAEEFLDVKIQDGEHDSVEDARAAMQLYMKYRKEWEEERRNKWLQMKAQLAKKLTVDNKQQHLCDKLTEM